VSEIPSTVPFLRSSMRLLTSEEILHRRFSGYSMT